MKNEIPALTRFWMVLNFEHQKSIGVESVDAYNQAMDDVEYHPIDTRFCMVDAHDAGWFLLEASGSVVIRAIEAGGMTAIAEAK